VTAKHTADRARRQAHAELSEADRDHVAGAISATSAWLLRGANSSVSGVTRNDRQCTRGSSRLSAARIARPAARPVANTAVQLAFEDADLVPEHHELDVLFRRWSPG
jgi:hypothetical protein